MSPEATTRVDIGASVHIDRWGWRHAGRRAWALNQITLDIRPGEHVLVLGASGSGKSTLLCGIAGVLGGDDEGESHGTLTVDGARPEQMRGSIGLVMQDPEAQVVLARAGDDVAFGAHRGPEYSVGLSDIKTIRWAETASCPGKRARHGSASAASG